MFYRSVRKDEVQHANAQTITGTVYCYLYGIANTVRFRHVQKIFLYVDRLYKLVQPGAVLYLVLNEWHRGPK